jgi:hypothetical protein
VALAAREERGERRILASMIAIHMVAVLLAGGDWMPGFRLLVPVLPVALLVTAGPLARRLEREPRWRGAALLAASLAVPIVSIGLVLPQVRGIAASRERVGEPLAQFLRTHARRVALVDVGFLPYRAGVEVVDLGGITDPAIGRAPGAHVAKEIDPGLLELRAPDAIVLHSSHRPRVSDDGRLLGLRGHPVERRVASMGFVRARYRVARVDQFADDYWYVTLTRGAHR